jgi:rfaE bifunctional protein kinase chain/domain
MIKKTTLHVLDNAASKQVCVLGDLMLDLYYFGDVKRISPEAPVQVFEKNSSEVKLGGAANVGLNIKSLGASPYMIGVVGKDEEGKKLKKIFHELGINTEGIIEIDERPTTCKTRVIASSHHLLRIDTESKNDISESVEEKIISLLKTKIKDFQAIILQDYNKGVLTKNLIPKVIKIANDNNVKVLVDPKFNNFFEYENVYVFKPNRKEMQDAFGRIPKTSEELDKISEELIEKIKCDNLVLTLGELGLRLYEKNGEEIIKDSIKTRARNVADVSGAGDTVISTLAVCIACGASIKDAVTIANFAAGLVVEEVGIVPVDREKLIQQILGQ